MIVLEPLGGHVGQPGGGEAHGADGGFDKLVHLRRALLRSLVLRRKDFRRGRSGGHVSHGVLADLLVGEEPQAVTGRGIECGSVGSVHCFVCCMQRRVPV